MTGAEWLYEWYLAHGVSPALDQRAHGILTRHQEEQIWEWEVPLGDE